MSNHYSQGDISTWLIEQVAHECRLPVEEVDVHQPFAELGISSSAAVSLTGKLELLLNRSLSPTLFWEHPTIAMLAESQVDAVRPNSAVSTSPEKSANLFRETSEAVAVVGLGCRLPGEIYGPADFWRFLCGGGDSIQTMPDDRWKDFASDSSEVTELLARTTRWGGFLKDIAGFDSEFFGITPREADAMDPQQRLLLEVTWEALEHAGLSPDSLRASNTGAYVGICSNDYGGLAIRDLTSVDSYSATGAAASIAANRLSYTFDWKGPSLSIDTACSSSLVAVHLAVRGLLSGECDAAVAGGVNLLLSPVATINFDQAGLLADDGRCKAFSASADGFTRAEGCGVVVLKRLSDAVRDQDRVLAIIRGSAVNQDGRSNGLMAPSVEAQEALLRSAYADAAISPDQLTYVEAHGTGTLLGDPIEAQALGSVLGRNRSAVNPLLIGSAKTNMGHLEAAAGIVGLIKATLSLHYGEIPGQLHFDRPSPHIDFSDLNLRVLDKTISLHENDRRSVIGVSSFGFGGTNSHVVLEGVSTGSSVDVKSSCPVELYMLAGATRDRVNSSGAQLRTWFDEDGRGADLDSVAHTTRRRASGSSRAVVVARGRDEAIDALDALIEGRFSSSLVTGERDPRPGSVVWVFPGQGSQWVGMGAQLLSEEAEFARTIERLDPIFEKIAGFSLRSIISQGNEIADIDRLQPVLFGLQVALGELWRSHGVKPSAVIGHSMGEVAAAVVSGALSEEEGLTVIVSRSRLLRGLPVGGAMAFLEMPAAKVQDLANKFPAVDLAVRTAPNQTVVAGPSNQIADMVSLAQELGFHAKLIRVDVASHSRQVETVLDRLSEQLRDIVGVKPEIPFYSSVSEDPRETPVFDSRYWASNLRHPVRFFEATSAAIEDGHRIFVEISPHPILTAAISDTAAFHDVSDVVALPTLRRDICEIEVLHHSLAALLVHGIANGPLEQPSHRILDLPTMPWRHRMHWRKPFKKASGAMPCPVSETNHPFLGERVDLPLDLILGWSGDVGTDAHPWISGHQIDGAAALPDSVLTELVVAASLDALGGTIENLQISQFVIHQSRHVGSRALISTVAVPSEGGVWQVQVHSKDASEQWNLLASAEVRSDDLLVPGPSYQVRSETSITVDAETLYGEFLRLGHSYGTALEGIERAHIVSDSSAFSTVSTPLASANDARYRLPPAVLEGCLQTLLAPVLPLFDPATGISRMSLRGFGSLRLYGDLSLGGICDAVITAYEPLSGSLIGDVRVVTPDGQTLSYSLTCTFAERIRAQQGCPIRAALPSWASAEFWEGPESLRAMQPSMARALIIERLRWRLSVVTGLSEASIDDGRPLSLMGVDSLMATRFKIAIENDFNFPIAVDWIMKGACIVEVQEWIAERLDVLGKVGREEVKKASANTESKTHERRNSADSVRLLKSGGDELPVFFFHAAASDSSVYQQLVDRLDDELPCFGMDRLDGTHDIRVKAASYVELMREKQVEGPYRLIGWSLGGFQAFEVAQQLNAEGMSVHSVTLIDTVRPLPEETSGPESAIIRRLERMVEQINIRHGTSVRLPYSELALLTDEEKQLELVLQAVSAAGISSEQVLQHRRPSYFEVKAIEEYVPSRYEGHVTLFRAIKARPAGMRDRRYNRSDLSLGWSDLCSDRLSVIPIPGHHLSILDAPDVDVLAGHLQQVIRAAR